MSGETMKTALWMLLGRPLSRLWQDDRGATSVEYTLVAAALSTGLVAGLGAYTPSISGAYAGIGGAISTFFGW